jgi:DNA topoisomerase-2
VAPSLDGFKQMSFVNSIATTKGGRHIDHVSKLIENALTDTLKKKNKGGINVKPHQVHTLQYCKKKFGQLIAPQNI